MDYLAVLVAAIALYAVGWLWFGYLFQTQWRRLMGVTSETMEEGRRQGRGMTMALGFLASLVICFVLAIFEGALGVETAAGGAIIAAWLWLGFVAPTMLNMVLYERRPWRLYAINVFQYLLALALAGIIIAVW
jgi:hypothetical protein